MFRNTHKSKINCFSVLHGSAEDSETIRNSRPQSSLEKFRSIKRPSHPVSKTLQIPRQFPPIRCYSKPQLPGVINSLQPHLRAIWSSIKNLLDEGEKEAVDALKANHRTFITVAGISPIVPPKKELKNVCLICLYQARVPGQRRLVERSIAWQLTTGFSSLSILPCQAKLNPVSCYVN